MEIRRKITTATRAKTSEIEVHVARLLKCCMCPKMQKPVVSGGPVVSGVVLIGQAPGVKEPVFGRPFAWTAGKTMFGWFQKYCGISEQEFRSKIYMAAVCRCFPGKKDGGGDRVPAPDEISNCSKWLCEEFKILKPGLVIPVGKLAIAQLGIEGKLDDIIGRKMRAVYAGHECDVVPLPHPSGASPWHRMPHGLALVEKAMKLIKAHPDFIRVG